MNSPLAFRLCLLPLIHPLIAGCSDSEGDDDRVEDASHPRTPDAGIEEAGVPLDEAPLSGLTDGVWNWVPFERARCRDGSTTGVGVVPSAGSDKLVLFLDGGGACFNEVTCGANPSHFDETTFETFTSGERSRAGILNRENPDNPVRDWNLVYVPYCTGDIHAGYRPEGIVAGVAGTQAFVGYENVRQYLGRLVPTFSAVTRVLVTGQSAGGFGSVLNYEQVARAFGSAVVHNLNDSAPLMDAPYVPECLSNTTASLWNFDRMRAECGPDCANGNSRIDLLRHVTRKFPKAAFGLLDDTGDDQVRLFYGFGENDCAPVDLPALVSEERYTEGLFDLRTKLAGAPNFGAFIFTDTVHTTLTTEPAFSELSVSGVRLTDWIRDIVDEGKVTNVGP